jgi:hypothetical protein
VGITKQLEKDAKDQILLAQKQMDLMASQYQESLRPLIAIILHRVGTNVYELELRNEGLGPALSVKCEARITVNGAVIGNKSAIAAFVSKTHSPGQQLFTVMYNSLDGELCWTLFCKDGSDFYVVDYRHLENDEAVKRARAYRDGFVAAVRPS